MIVFLVCAAVVAALAGVVLGARLTAGTVEVLRTELNSSRANEQLLLTRLASRTPAEFHAVTAPAAPAPADDGMRHVWDPTGLIEAEVPRGDG